MYDELDFTGRWFGPRTLWLEGITDNSKTNHPWNYGWDEARGVADATSGMSNDFWAVNWRAIMKANRILDNEGTEIKDADPDKMVRLYGEARFLRAYYYAELTMLFGDVPLLTTQISPDEAKSIAKASQSEVLDFLADDLEQAAAALPVVS